MQSFIKVNQGGEALVNLNLTLNTMMNKLTYFDFDEKEKCGYGTE